MKNISLIINVVLIIAVILLYIDRFSGNNDTNDVTDNTNIQKNIDESNFTNNVSVVYVNLDSLLPNYELYKELKDVYNKNQQNHQANLNAKLKSYEKKAGEFQQKVEQRLITQRQAQETQQRLIKEQQDLMELKDKLSYKMLQDEQIMNKQIYDSIKSFLTDYNSTHPYNIVMGGNVLYAKENLDITPIVISGLNKRYIGDNNK